MIDFTQGANRPRIERDQAVALLTNGTLAVDERRRRPFYFDGRFLTARDLIREQNYFLARQADLGRAEGSGVITGLNVTQTGGSTMAITRGNGITMTGELVTVSADLSVNLADVTTGEQLDASFGIAAIPATPARNRSGVYIVALRPVEFTANPIVSYPKSLVGTRSIEDGDIVEAVAVTLIPYTDESSSAEINLQRARVARNIFLNQAPLQSSVNSLPIAMLSLSKGALNWVDPFLVRREIGADHGDTLGLGIAPRALREAQLQQYEAHLQSVLVSRKNQGFRFAATDYFFCLPAVGPMPAASFDGATMTQTYLPPGIQVEVSVIPDDELRGMVEDALLLPPIDLTLRDQEQQSTSVLLVAPVPRASFNQIDAGLLAPAPQPGPLPPVLFAGKTPAQLLGALNLANLSLPLERRQLTIDDRWRAAIAQVQAREANSGSAALWYVRRRNLAYRSDISGASVQVAGDDAQREAQMQQLVAATGLKARLDALKVKANVTPAAISAMETALAQPKYTTATIGFQVAFFQFERQASLTAAAARSIAGPFDDPKFGTGLQLLTAQPYLAPGAATTAGNIILLATYPSIVAFDQLLQTVDATKLPIVSAKLVAAGNNQQAVNTQIDTWVKGGPIQ
jgi:hypothetical protein